MPYWLQDILESRYLVPSLVAVPVVVLLWYLVRRQPKVFTAFGEGADRVKVTRKAVRELVQRCCEQLGDVGSAQARVIVRRGALHTRVQLRLRKTANLKGIAGYLKEQISLALTENLGIEKLGEIEIVVVGILADLPDEL